MPKLKLHKITCHQTEDTTGADEAFLTLNGNVIWGPISMNNGQSKSLATLAEFSFSSTISIQLFDQDTGFLDPDDLLGSATIGSAEAGQGIKSCSFTGDSANYTLEYEVKASVNPGSGGGGAPDGKKAVLPASDSSDQARGSASITVGADGIAVLSMKVDAPAGGNTTRYVAFGLITGYKGNEGNSILLEIEPQSLTVASSPLQPADKDRSWYFPLKSEDVPNVRYIRVFLERDKTEADLATQIINTCRKAGEVWDAADSLYKKVKDSELGKAVALAAA